MSPVPDSLHSAIRSALARSSALGEPSSVLVIGLEDAEPQAALALVAANVRAADVVEPMGDGTYAIVLFSISRLASCSGAERLERRIEPLVTGPSHSRVGMTLIGPWERRAPARVLAGAWADLRERHTATWAELVAA